jgi:proteasome lid subunit RPN8/RPN11
VNTVCITSAIREEIVAHARSEPRRECCGLLAGRDGVITRAFPARNAANTPATRYEIAPAEIFERMREMRELKLDLLGIYHSHPNSKNEPSPRDIELAFYPETPYLIVSPLARRPIRAFLIADSNVREIEIDVVAAG